MPPPPAAHGTTNRWRTGCRCDPCTDAHNTDSREHRQRQAERTLAPTVRKQILRSLRSGSTVPEAAGAVGLTQQVIWGRARADQDWRQALDKALLSGRRPGVPHGSPMGYRHYRCRCPECRAAHHGVTST